ncbi:MAG: Uma2 family endonuclease [Devosia sp.]|nr:Uma2 family endonuclease [Devosia sp.]
MAEVAPKRTIYEELEAVPPDLVAEIIGGNLITHPRPSRRHVTTAAALTLELGGPFQKGLGGPGGWVFADEPELHLGSDVLVPDLAGWRRERLNAHPETNYFTTAPDWICEILSASTERRDRTIKTRAYAEAGIPYFWLIDPRQQLLEAFELDDGQWKVLGGWNSDDEVRAAPFDAVSFSLADLWPLDKPLGFNDDPQALYAGDR